MIIPPWLAVMATAATPILEIRGALPLATEVYRLPFWIAYGWSVLGNIIPPVLILFFWRVGLRVIAAPFPRLHILLERIGERARRKLGPSYDLYGAIALCLFVAVPLPLTGAWTGAIAAAVFGIRPRAAIPAILAGIAIAGFLVGGLTSVLVRLFVR